MTPSQIYLRRNMHMFDELLKPRQTAKILNCSQSHIYDLADKGVLKCVKWNCNQGEGKRSKKILRFKLEHVMAFIEESTVSKKG